MRTKRKQMTVEEATALIAELERLTEDPPPDVIADSSVRRKLREAAKNFSIALEMPGDTVHRIGNAAMQSSLARVGTDVKLFEILSESTGAMSSADLAEKTGMVPSVMKRLLRYYQSMRMVAQADDDMFEANNVSRALTPPGGIGIKYIMEILNPAFDATPGYLRSHNYREITNPVDTPFQIGHKMTEHPFVWFPNNPDKLELFLQWMAHNRDGLPSWLDTYPFDQEIRDTTDDTVLFVDIGSARGHMSIELRERFPKLPGRIVIQDLEHIISTVTPPHGIEPMTYDFNNPQPVKGARAYYLRMILHDYPDEKCREILRNTISAMDEDSVILIDEIVLPEVNAIWRATQMDMTMMTALAGKERSENEWYDLLESVDLEVVKVWKYTEESEDCIIVARPKKFLK